MHDLSNSKAIFSILYLVYTEYTLAGHILIHIGCKDLHDYGIVTIRLYQIFADIPILLFAYWI